MPLATASGSGTSLLVFGALVLVAILVRQGRLRSRTANLNRGERLRPLAITCIDPLISLVIIGPLLWHLVSASSLNALAAIGGAIVGAVIGYFRARVMFVRAEKGSFSVVLRRSGVEYALVFLLIVLRSIEGQLALDHVSAATIAVAALAGLGLIEAFARAGFIIGRYATHHELPTTVESSDGGAPALGEAGGPEMD